MKTVVKIYENNFQKLIFFLQFNAYLILLPHDNNDGIRIPLCVMHALSLKYVTPMGGVIMTIIAYQVDQIILKLTSILDYNSSVLMAIVVVVVSFYLNVKSCYQSPT